MIVRAFWLCTYVVGCMWFMVGCQTFPIEPELDPMTVASISEPIRLAYQPFGPIHYRQSITGPPGVTSDAILTAARISGQLILTVKYGDGVINGKYWSGAGYDTTLRMDDSGEILDAVARNGYPNNVASSDDPNILEQKNAFRHWLLPIYAKTPISMGDFAGRTSSVRSLSGMGYYTMFLRGIVNFRGKRAVRLNVDRIVLEQKFDPFAPDSVPTRGYFIVDPDNGTVLMARSRGLSGYQIIVDAM